ncbi:MAG: glutamate--tRNA ligase [Holosporaceae bacterium]|jgi:glutamyl-tRNA synthetase|nr:glutamate--tRNA ligase [Holosporaceae bacterium]
MSVRVRFAPSPTGFLHVGNVRIAILNYLFAKKNNGAFILRIDDTDPTRSTKECENMILKDLKWLKIQWDEFYKQSDRFEKYSSAINRLKSSERIYVCYETKEELSIKKKIQASKGKPPVYDRASLALTKKQIEKFESNGIKPYWRFRLNNEECAEWNDLVHGKISIPLGSISDPIVIKPDGSFVYTFASVVDDVDLNISHIIRGDDHITNTAVQIDLFKALNGSFPDFAHVPLLSSLDGHDVSKRSGSPLSIVNMRKDGIEPNAILNILATLGTSNNAIYNGTINDLIEKFSFEKMSLSSPKFDIENAKSFSQKILSEKTFEEVKNQLQKLNISNVSEDFWNTIKGNLRSIKESVFWHDVLCNKISIVKENESFVNQMLKTLPNPVDFDGWISDLKKVSGKKGRDLFHPIRTVLTGLEYGPELKKIIGFLGYNSIKSRIENNLKAS